MALPWDRQGSGGDRCLGSWLVPSLEHLAVSAKHQVRALALPQLDCVLLTVRKLLLHDLLQLLSSVSCCYWIAAEDQLGHLW